MVGALLAKRMEVSALKKEIRKAKERAVNTEFRLKREIHDLIEREWEEKEDLANVEKVILLFF